MLKFNYVCMSEFQLCFSPSTNLQTSAMYSWSAIITADVGGAAVSLTTFCQLLLQALCVRVTSPAA